MPDEDLVTRNECERSHAGMDKSIDGLTEQLGKIWDSLDTWRATIAEWRNHMPPWGVALVSFLSTSLGAAIAVIAILSRG